MNWHKNWKFETNSDCFTVVSQKWLQLPEKCSTHTTNIRTITIHRSDKMNKERILMKIIQRWKEMQKEIHGTWFQRKKKKSPVRKTSERVMWCDNVGSVVNNFSSSCMFGQGCWRVNSVHVKEAWRTACIVTLLRSLAAERRHNYRRKPWFAKLFYWEHDFCSASQVKESSRAAEVRVGAESNDV